MTSMPASSADSPPADRVDPTDLADHADHADRVDLADRADLTGLAFAPSVRVLRRSQREIQIERGDQAVIVRDLPEDLLAQLHRHGHTGRAGSSVGSGHDGRGTTKGPEIVLERRGAFDRTNAATDLSPADHPHADHGVSIHAETAKALRALAQAGFLSRTDTCVPPRQAEARFIALEPDAVALSDRFGSRAATVLQSRHHRSVRVHGTGRLAPLIAALLAAAGVGEVRVPDTADVSLHDVVPGGLLPADEGHRTAVAAADAVRRARAGTPAESVPGRVADLVIVTSGTPVALPLRAALLADRGPHLITGVCGSGATIGPLVVPGRTSCLHCADLHRSDRDPAWPVLAAQLSAETTQPAHSEVAVCALAAAVTAVQALAFLDGERPATADGTLEFRLPDWRLRRRQWSRHAQCPCAA